MRQRIATVGTALLVCLVLTSCAPGGAPVTTDDLLFTLQLNQDPQLVEFNNPRFRLISGVDAVDARTITVHWSAPLIDADALFTRGSSGAGGGFANPLPKHLLERP